MKRFSLLILWLFSLYSQAQYFEPAFVSGPNTIYSSESATFTVSHNIQGPVMYSWILPSGFTVVGGGISQSSVTIKPLSGVAGPQFIFADVMSVYGTKYASGHFSFAVLPQTHINILGPKQLSTYGVYSYTAINSLGEKVNWTISDNDKLAIVSGQGSNTLTIRVKDQVGKALIVAEVYKSTGLESIAIGVDIQYSPYKIVAPDCMCNNETGVFRLPNLPVGATVTWSGVDKMELISGQGTNSATFRATSGKGFGKVRAEITHENNLYVDENSEVWVGVPGIKNASMAYFSKNIELKRIQINATSNIIGGINTANCAKWVNLSSIYGTLSPGCNDVLVSFKKMTGTMDIKGSFTNKCGEGSIYFYIDILPGQNENYPPNKPTPLRSSSSDETLSSINVYNLSGQTVYKTKNIYGDFDINSTNLTNGIYIIEKFEGNNISRKKVILNRK